MIKHIIQPGRYLLGIAIIGFGIINFITGNFPTAFLPVINSTLLRILLVYITGLVFVTAGVCIIINKFSKTAAILTALLFFIDFLYTQLTNSLLSWNSAGQWTVTLEVLAICSGNFILAAALKDESVKPIISNKILLKISRIAGYTLALSLLGFGVLHYMYADYIVTLIPNWMPARTMLSYFVLFGFVATAVSIIINIKTRLATLSSGIMFLIWVVTLHLPRCIVNPSKEAEWSSLFIALAMSGIGFILYDGSRKKITSPVQNAASTYAAAQ